VTAASTVRAGRTLRALGAAGGRIGLWLGTAFAAGAAFAWLLEPFRPASPRGHLVWASAVVCVGLAVATAVCVRYVDRQPLAAVGLHGDPVLVREAARGAALGAGLMTAVVTLLWAAGTVRWESAGVPEAAGWLETALGLTAFLAVAAASEELLFRGYAFHVLARAFGGAWAVGMTAALFAIAHLANPHAGSLGLLNLALAGLLLGAARLRTGSLWFVTGLHLGWNWVLAVPLDQPVSGLRFDVPGYDVRETGPDWLTGGAFGPEGGVAATALTAAAVAWAARTRRLRPSPAVPTEHPIPRGSPPGPGDPEAARG
jgi:membrane protease YdiL (CAAX protease family)